VSQDGGFNSQYNGDHGDGGDLRVFYVALDETIVERASPVKRGGGCVAGRRQRETRSPGSGFNDVLGHSRISPPRLHRVAAACKLRASLDPLVAPPKSSRSSARSERSEGENDSKASFHRYYYTKLRALRDPALNARSGDETNPSAVNALE